MANMTMNIPTRVSISGITVWNHATSVSCTLETSEVRRVTRSPDRFRSWNRNDNDWRRPNASDLMSAPIRSVAALIRYVIAYPRSPESATTMTPTNAATAASMLGDRPSSIESHGGRGLPPITLSTTTFSGHGEARSSTTATPVSAVVLPRTQRYGRTNRRRERRARSERSRSRGVRVIHERTAVVPIPAPSAGAPADRRASVPASYSFARREAGPDLRIGRRSCPSPCTAVGTPEWTVRGGPIPCGRRSAGGAAGQLCAFTLDLPAGRTQHRPRTALGSDPQRIVQVGCLSGSRNWMKGDPSEAKPTTARSSPSGSRSRSTGDPAAASPRRTRTFPSLS